MIAGGRDRKMPCESCAVQFSVFKRKRACCECERFYCSSCLRRGGGAMCLPCRVLSTRPLYRNNIAHLKVRDLQCFLQRQNVSTRGCVEKEELISLCVSHVNGATYRRRGAHSTGAFSSLKGFTNNINDFLNSAFTPQPQPQPPPEPCQTRLPTYRWWDRKCSRPGCFNSSHTHPAPGGAPHTYSRPAAHYNPTTERFTTTPGGERDIEVSVPPADGLVRTPSAESARVESADCFEIEDLDDAGWEFVASPPADPLPNDSDILLSTTDGTARRREPPVPPAAPSPAPPPPPPRPAPDVRLPDPTRSPPSRHSLQSDFERIADDEARNSRPSISREYLTPGLSQSGGAGGGGGGADGGGGGGGGRVRAASELELRSGASSPSETGSLNDELLEHTVHSNPATPRHVTLEQMKGPSELETLNVKQLKELLTRNRVEYRGCIERQELLDKARMLWRDHAQYKDEIDNLPIEECCKICMAAPLECVLLECGHIAACTRCSKQLAECPICRQYVVRAVRFFRS